MRIASSRGRGLWSCWATCVVALATLAIALAGCGGSKQQTQAATAQGKLISRQEEEVPKVPKDTLNMGHFNRHLHIRNLALLGTGSHRAAVIQLFDVTALQANLPVLIHVIGPQGELAYSNGGPGQDPVIQRVGLLLPGHDTWWVDDQISLGTTAAGFRVKVGTSTSPLPHPLPNIATTGVKLEPGGAGTVSGTLVNRSAKAERNVVISAVALAGQRIVGAGRAVVRTLPASPARAPFRISLVSSGLKGERVELSVMPTAG